MTVVRRFINWLGAGATAAVRGLFVAHEIIVRKRTPTVKSRGLTTKLREGRERPPSDPEAR